MTKLPARLQPARTQVIDDAMGSEFAVTLGGWFSRNVGSLVRGGDDAGESRFNFELTDLDRHCPLMTTLRARLVEALPEVIETLGVEAFSTDWIETNGTLYHHGSHFEWHDDRPGYDGTPVPSRRISYCYYVHTEPRMFNGGELEFVDGTSIGAKNDRLVLFDPNQKHRVRTVKCWSREAVHGRWAVMGWFHAKDV